ncbi:lactate utilization protein C [Pontibacterium sp.]|uniref:LutC/YkgG family protein n=1 Tax=Pontibacterium sp. TaxID=2036026 RepID=UPI003517DF50
MSKAEILGNIRRGLGRGEPNAKQRTAAESRLAAKDNNLIPKRAQLPQAEQVKLFKDMAIEAAAEIIELDSIAEVPMAASEWLHKANIQELVTASSPELKGLDWSALGDIQLSERVGQVGDMASITSSFAGIAETGTLMLHSSSDSPTTLNFLPDVHMVVLHASTIVGPYEDAWKQLRTTHNGVMPRTVNMITGPSRSADIEQKLQMGAHGPRTLVILLVND